MFVANYREALQQAQENARYFDAPFDVFQDTSGNYRVERATLSPRGVCRTRYYPNGRSLTLEPEDGAGPLQFPQDDPQRSA